MEWLQKGRCGTRRLDGGTGVELAVGEVLAVMTGACGGGGRRGASHGAGGGALPRSGRVGFAHFALESEAGCEFHHRKWAVNPAGIWNPIQFHSGEPNRPKRILNSEAIR
jgi:hypothetical protein